MANIYERPILIIDGLNLHTRHYIANPTMSDMGHQVGGVVGFLKGIQLLANKFHPPHVCVVWEGGGSPRRRAIYSNYKSKRKPQKLNRYYEGDIPDTVENRNYQIMLLIELLRKTPIQQFYISDCEADDIIAYLVKYKFRNRQCMIVSSDKDYYQLLDNRVLQWSPGQKKIIRPEDVEKKFGIKPSNFCLARSFIGDMSDAVPGIKGAGFKTMIKRFPELAGDISLSVRDILELSKERATKKIKLFKEINENPDVPLRNWKLMYLDISGLAHMQIQKLEATIDTFKPQRDKINFMRTLIREGISTFDTDIFFMSLNTVGKE